MNGPVQQLSHASEADPVLNDLLADFANRLELGEPVDAEAYVREHPEWAQELRRLLPAIQVLADLERVAGGGDAAVGSEPMRGVLGDFRLLREVGRGGMGIVYEAEQISLNRRVALKVLPFAATMDARQLKRFQNEARAAAALHHTNIVPVYFVGCERGVHYYAMQFIDGQDLASIMAQRRAPAGSRGISPMPPVTEEAQAGPAVASAALPDTATRPIAGLSTERSPRSPEHYRTVARLGIQAAEALDHAHQQGIVHRDVKPANLLVDAEGRLWVTDFGLAHIQSDARLTITGDLVGTLRYMSPEQALAKRVVVDHRTDVYSLGATLYELLTLEPVFAGNDRQELLRQIAFEEPKAPRRHNKSIPAELEIIVVKALEKNPGERYATAQEFADDLRRFLEDKPIQARRPTLRQHAIKWARRHRPVVWSAAVTVVLTLAVLGGSVGWVLRDRASRQAEAEVPVATAAAEAERLLGEGKAREALSAAERAEGLLAQAGGHPRLSPHVRQLVKDLRMRLTLEEIRLTSAIDVRDGHFDFAGADQAYAEAFKVYGLDVQTLPLAEAAARIRASRIGADLAAALNDWAWALKDLGREKESWRRLLTVARAADPDEWRNRLRDVVEGRDGGALAALGGLEEADILPAPTLALLVQVLRNKHDSLVQAVPLLRRAQQKQPDDFWVNHLLAFTLQEMRPPQLDEAVAYFRVAVALSPKSPGARLNFGNALRGKNHLGEAIAEYREAARLKPEFAEAHNNLGRALADMNRPGEAAAEFREALRLKPGLAEAHVNVGNSLRDQGRLDEAAAEFREALRLKPGLAEAHLNVGNCLRGQGRLDEAIAEYREAARLKPGYASAHTNLGAALLEKGRSDEAIAAHQNAIRLMPDGPLEHNNLGAALMVNGRLEDALAEFRTAVRFKEAFPEAHRNLGLILEKQGLLEGAVAEYRAAVRLRPDYFKAYDNLGQALRAHGDVDGAIAAYRAAIKLKSDFAEAHCHLGQILGFERGQFAEALIHVRRGHELGMRQPGWPHPSAQLVKECERSLELDSKLPRLLKGEIQPADVGERLAVAQLCQLPCKSLYVAALRFYAEAFAAQPQLTSNQPSEPRYNAACAAALAGCGQGKDTDQLDAKERVRLRQQALDWLRDDLKAYRQTLDKAPDKTGPAIAQRMQHWLQDNGFAGVHGSDALAKLPEGEGLQWRKLWEGVEALRKRAAGRAATGSPASPSDKR